MNFRHNTEITTSPTNFVLNTLRGTFLGRNDSIELINSATWFLPCLFVTFIYFYLIDKFFKNKIYKICFLFLLSLIVYIDSNTNNTRLPFNLDIALMGVFFFGLANTFKDKILTFIKGIKFKYLLYLPIIIILHIYFLNEMNMSVNYYGNYFKLIICVLLGTLTFTIIAKNIAENKILSFLGSSTIGIFCLEWIKIPVFSRLIILSNNKINFEPSILNGFLEAIIAIMSISIIIIFWNQLTNIFNSSRNRK